MSDSIRFFTNPLSRGRIAHWMLEEVGAPYEVQVLDFERGEHKRPDYLAINPMGKVPSIVHRGTVVTEAAAICAYLADAFPDAKLAPAVTEPARGTYLRWLFFAASCIEPAVLGKAFPRTNEPPPGSLGYGSHEDVLNALERALTPGPYVLENRFSAADVYLGAQLGWSMMMQWIEPRAVFQQYVARLTERPAHQRFLEKSAELESRVKAR